MPSDINPDKAPMETANYDDVRRLKLNILLVPTLEGFEFIDVDTIICLMTFTKFLMFKDIKIIEQKKDIKPSTVIVLDNTNEGAKPKGYLNAIASSKNIGFFEEPLKSHPFIRIHDSYLANINKAKKYVTGDDGYLLMAAGPITLRVSREKRNDLLNFLQPGRRAG